MRWIICMAAMTVGCVASMPPGDTSISADLANETARMVILSRRDIRPAPQPVSDQCENCGGRGRVRSGDGLSEFTCPVCKGTGKKPKPAAAATAPICTTGTCRK